MTRQEQHKQRKRENKGLYYYYVGDDIWRRLYVHSWGFVATNIIEDIWGYYHSKYVWHWADPKRHVIIESD